MSHDEVFRKRCAGSTPIGDVVLTVCGILRVSDGPQTTEVVHSYGLFVNYPSHLSERASDMLRSSSPLRIDDVASTMPRSCHCGSKESWQMPPMGRTELADRH